MIETYQAVLLAILQGLTEFLPISSSAHLIIPSLILDWPDQGLAFDVAVHVGTLSAVLFYYRADLAQMAGSWFASLAGAPGTSRQQVLRIDEEPQAPLSPGERAALAADLRARAVAAQVVAVSDYGVGTLDSETIATCQALAGDGLPVVVDSRYRLNAYVGVTAVTAM